MTDKEFELYINEKYENNRRRLEEICFTMEKIKDDTARRYYYYKMRSEIFRLYKPIVEEELAYVTAINFNLHTQEIWETSQKLRQLEQSEVLDET